jgi:hypothetical protein
MNKSIFLMLLLASMLALAVSKPTPAADDGRKVSPASLAERDLAVQSCGDVAALYSDDAIVQGGGLCWIPCVGEASIQKELESRVVPTTMPRSSANTCLTTKNRGSDYIYHQHFGKHQSSCLSGRKVSPSASGSHIECRLHLNLT